MDDPFANGDPELSDYSLTEEESRIPGLHSSKEFSDADAIKRERPEHRMVLYLKLAGNTNQEIAEITGYGYGQVCKITRQKWFGEAFTKICQENGKDAIEEMFKAESMNSVMTLIEIRDDYKAKHADRRQAAEHLLDRHLGKPTQRSESNVNVWKSPKQLNEADKRIDDEISALEKELQGGQYDN